MKVTLVNYTNDAARMLILAKSTRLNLDSDLIEKILRMNQTEIEQELDYIANTIPSAWEFVHYTFLVEGVSRNCTHQMVRTRTGSYAEQSMRVTDQSDFDFIYPKKDLKYKLTGESNIENTLDVIKDNYKILIAEGFQPEDARSILPGNISTNILCAYNLRTFSDLIKSRSGGRTQDEYQKIIHAMANAVIEVHPWAIKFMYNKSVNYFDEIEAFAKRKFSDLKERGELLKIVDKMRKEITKL
jgi:flavin-dependent thymidylate synthase